MSSPEYMAYRQCIPEINSTVANNVGLEWFATELLEAAIIADTVANKMVVLGISNLQKANVLTSAISSRLKSDPDSFLTVITIMKKEPAFAYVLEKLSKAYEGDSNALKSALKSTSSGESDRQALKDLPLTLPNLLNELNEVTDSHNFGLNLGVPLSELKAIEQNYPRNAVRQKTETLSYWLDNEEDPSWEKIASAVEKRHRSLARRIRGEQPPAPSKPEPGLRERRPANIQTQDSTPDVPDKPSSPDENRARFHEAMKGGHVAARTVKVLIHGIAGSGKTSMMHVIFEDEQSKIRKSTPLAERPIKARRVAANSSEWCKIGPKEMSTLLAKSMVSYCSSRKHLSSFHKGSRPKTPPSTPGDSGQPGTQPSSPPVDAAVTTTSPSKQEHAPQLPVLETVDKLVQLMGQVSGSDIVVKMNFIHFIDSGGQPQFLELLPIFLRGTSVYMVVTNLSQMFGQYPMVEIYESGRLIGKSYRAAHTNEEILKQCITTMQSQGAEGDRPKIMVIGTFKDKERYCPETRETKNQKLLKMLLPTFQNEIIYSSRDMKQLIFPLNAKTPGEPEYKIADEIRREIMKYFPRQPDEVPLRWYALELLLKRLAESHGRDVLSRDECFVVARRLQFDEESFKAALNYLDGLNIIYYYPKILPNVVFSDPQVLLDKLTELVKYSYELKGKPDPNETKVYSGECQQFRDHGLVTRKFLACEKFRKHYVPNLFTVDELIKLFKDLLILADFKESTYFMPCILENLSSEKVEQCRLPASSLPAPLAIHFPQGPRYGVFCLLMTFLRSPDNHFPYPWKLLLKDGNSPSCLYRNCIEFTIPDYPGSIVLIDSFTFFEVHVKDVPSGLCSEIGPQLCAFIQEAVFAGLDKATTILHYAKFKPDAAFVCPCGEGDIHPATLGASRSFRICTKNRKSEELTENQRVWFPPKSFTSAPLMVERNVASLKHEGLRKRDQQSRASSLDALSLPGTQDPPQENPQGSPGTTPLPRSNWTPPWTTGEKMLGGLLLVVLVLLSAIVGRYLYWLLANMDGKSTAKCTEVKSLKVVRDELKEISEWKIFGQDLGLDETLIDQIDKDEHTVEDKRRSVIKKWFKGSEHSCWEDIVGALMGMKDVKLATHIAKKYGVDYQQD